MTATKMNAQELSNLSLMLRKKRQSVKVTFEGQLDGVHPCFCYQAWECSFGDAGKISLHFLEGLTSKDYVVDWGARNSAVPLLDKRDIQ